MIDGSLEPRDSFSSYVLPLRDRPLTIFMPFAHPQRTAAMAQTFRARGHRLMLSDASSTAKIRADQPVSPAAAREAYGPNVSSYQDNEIFDNPPDVIIVGAHGQERDCLLLHKQLILKKPIALIAMSGIAQMPIDYPAYEGMICCDLPSRLLARCHQVSSHPLCRGIVDG